METTQLERFCELLDDNLPLDNSSAISFYHKIKKECMPKLKSEISKNLVALSDGSKKDYLDYVISEIESQHYFKDVKVQTLEEHFKRHNIDFEKVTEILRFEFDKIDPKFYRLLETNYKSFEPFSSEKDEAFLFQNDFVNFVCSFCAEIVIGECKKKYPKPIELPKPKKPDLPFEKQYLDVFCDAISDERELNTTSLMMLFDTDLTHYGPFLEKEVRENLLKLDNDKKNTYLDYAIDVIEKTPFATQEKDYISKWLEQYNSSAENFPENISEELKKKLNTYWKARHLDQAEQFHLQDIQIDFFVHLAREQAQKMISFLKAQKEPGGKKLELEEKASLQLTSNQIVLLLQETGFFSHPKIESAPKTKQAQLINMFTGLNEKNIKSNIQKLDKSPKESPKYQADMDKIDQILNSLN